MPEFDNVKIGYDTQRDQCGSVKDDRHIADALKTYVTTRQLPCTTQHPH